MPELSDIIKPELIPILKKGDIPNFLKRLDLNKSHQRAIWSAKTYSVDPKTHVFTTIQEHFGNRLIHRLPVPVDGVVVDVGCFIGEKLWQIDYRHKYLGIGVDIAVPSLRAAKQIDIYDHRFIAADLEHLPFKNNSVDIVMAFDVVEHLSDFHRGFSEIARVLKPGGLVLLHTPLKNNRWSMFWWKQQLFPGAARKDYRDVGHTADRVLTSGQILASLKKNQLRLDREIYYNSFFVHFWDREFVRILSQLMIKYFRRDLSKKSSAKEVHSGRIGQARIIYGKYIIPLLEIISFPDLLLSRLKIGNTYFVLARKSL